MHDGQACPPGTEIESNQVDDAPSIAPATQSGSSQSSLVLNDNNGGDVGSSNELQKAHTIQCPEQDLAPPALSTVLVYV